MWRWTIFVIFTLGHLMTATKASFTESSFLLDPVTHILSLTWTRPESADHGLGTGVYCAQVTVYEKFFGPELNVTPGEGDFYNCSYSSREGLDILHFNIDIISFKVKQFRTYRVCVQVPGEEACTRKFSIETAVPHRRRKKKDPFVETTFHLDSYTHQLSLEWTRKTAGTRGSCVRLDLFEKFLGPQKLLTSSKEDNYECEYHSKAGVDYLSASIDLASYKVRQFRSYTVCAVLEGENKACTRSFSVETIVPYVEDTTHMSYSEDTTVVPYNEDTTVIPYSEDTSVITYSEDTSVITYSENTTVVPYSDDTTVVPYRDNMMVVPYSEDTTAVSHIDDKTVIPYSDDTTNVTYSEDTTPKPYSEDKTVISYSKDIITVVPYTEDPTVVPYSEGRMALSYSADTKSNYLKPNLPFINTDGDQYEDEDDLEVKPLTKNSSKAQSTTYEIEDGSKGSTGFIENAIFVDERSGKDSFYYENSLENTFENDGVSLNNENYKENAIEAYEADQTIDNLPMDDRELENLIQYKVQQLSHNNIREKEINIEHFEDGSKQVKNTDLYDAVEVLEKQVDDKKLNQSSAQNISVNVYLVVMMIFLHYQR